MLFNSITFFMFFVAVCALHFCSKTAKAQKIILLCASYLFYAAWNPPFVLLLLISTLIDWNVAQKIEHSKGQIQRRILLLASLVPNLGMLAFFKYGDFVLRNVNVLLEYAGAEPMVYSWDIVLPVGISFYTFQTLSYTLDVYFGRNKTAKNLLDYSLYVAFFPQLVAGPIVRASDFLNQCAKVKKVDLQRLHEGVLLITVGLFEKMVVADTFLAPVADKVFGAVNSTGSVGVWIGTAAFTFQIFCDFAGYSTCAIGVARILGFYLPKNFQFPYAATSLSDFWNRWHISLSTWLRDYLYIPLGGNRKGWTLTTRNLLVTMLLGGLWHGASWNFVIWGGLHGLLLVVQRLFEYAVPVNRENSIVRVLSRVVTLLFVMVTWVFFRSNSVADAKHILEKMFFFKKPALKASVTVEEIAAVLGLSLIIVALHWYMAERDLLALFKRVPLWVHGCLLTLGWYAILTIKSASRTFIYFQF
jgi:D-alanyl-lipoteichoic acid acyltransferase DltB (MBOAT superfamily)